MPLFERTINTISTHLPKKLIKTWLHSLFFAGNKSGYMLEFLSEKITKVVLKRSIQFLTNSIFVPKVLKQPLKE